MLSGIDSLISTLLPIITLLPITVSPPKIEAPEYITTLFNKVGCLFLSLSFLPSFKERAPKVTP